VRPPAITIAAAQRVWESHRLFLEIAACDRTCECWGRMGICEDTRPPPNRRPFPNAFPQDQRVDPNPVSLRVLRLAGKWSGRWESNPRLKLGKLGYYHYTTPASVPDSSRLWEHRATSPELHAPPMPRCLSEWGQFPIDMLLERLERRRRSDSQRLRPRPHRGLELERSNRRASLSRQRQLQRTAKGRGRHPSRLLRRAAVRRNDFVKFLEGDLDRQPCDRCAETGMDAAAEP
jgi:hypothetical protein